MDIGFMLGIFEVPSDHPRWEATLLSCLARVEGKTPEVGSGGGAAIPVQRPLNEDRGSATL